MTENRRAATPTGADKVPANVTGADGISAEAVAAWLNRHPGFLTERPELLEALAAPSRTGGKVVDMQDFLLQRLRDENRRLRDAYAAMVATARENQSIQGRMHEAILRILAAPSFEHLIQTVTTDLAVLLDVDVVTICVETGNAPIPRTYTAQVRPLPAGAVRGFIGDGRDVVLSGDTEGDARLFGSAAGLVRSVALVRLKISPKAPNGLLAIGARQPEVFHAGQGTELIGFLARALEGSIRQWLNLPN